MTSRPYSRQTLASYALFENARQQGRPPQHALLPLIAPFMAGRGGQAFVVDDLADSLKQLFGDNFSAFSVEGLVPQLASDGYLVELSRDDQQVIYAYSDKVNDIAVDEKASKAEADIDEIIVEFLAYLHETKPLFAHTYNKTEWKKLFIQWATTVDVSDKAGLRSWIDQFIASEKRPTLQLSGNMEVEEKFFGLDKHIIVLFASYAQYLHRNRSDLFDKVVVLAEIGFLIDLVSEIRAPIRPAPKSIDLTVVLDGPVLLDALGFMGPGRKSASDCLRRLCKTHGIKIIVLQHLVDEAREIIQAVLGQPDPKRGGMLGDALRRDQVALLRARRFVNNPDGYVSDLGISSVKASVISSAKSVDHFTDKDIDDFTHRLPYQGGNLRKLRDAKSIAFVMRRRDGFTTADMYRAKYVLLTRSPLLSEFAAKYVRKKNEDFPAYAINPAVEVRHFSTLFLLTFGGAIGEPIARGELLSSCELVMKSSPDIIKKVRETVEQLSLFPKEELDAMLNDPVALYEITAATGNDPELVTPENAAALADIIKNATIKDERIRHKKDIERREKEFGSEIEKVRQEAEAAKFASASNAIVIQRKDAERDELATRIFGECETAADQIWLACAIVFSAISVGALGYLFFKPDQLTLWARILVLGCVLLLAAYSLANRLRKNFSILGLRTPLENWLVKRRSERLPEGDIKVRLLEIAGIGAKD